MVNLISESMLSVNSDLDLEVQGQCTKYVVFFNSQECFSKGKGKKEKKHANEISKSQRSCKNGLLKLRVVLELHLHHCTCPLDFAHVAS